jgi:glycosyltransferase involved in cell wall biosynthesis
LRVLWFTNTPSLSAKYLNNKSIGGGWIGSLEAELSNIQAIELGISFNYEQELKAFSINKTTYFPIHIASPKGKIKNFLYRWTKPILNESNIHPYLHVINEFKPDIIHIFGTEGVFGLIIPKTNVPCVIHLQGNLTICDHKWFSGLSLVDTLRYSKKWALLKGFGIYHSYLLNKQEAKRERKVFQECKFFMGRTNWDRRISSVLSPDSKYFHCDEIIRSQFYSLQWLPKNRQTDCIMITTIRNTIYKGLETIFECKKLLNKINLEYKIIWKIAGVSETDEISCLIERKYKSTFIENDIHLLGPLQESELVNEMLEADVFVHPSHIDNSPNSVCEAMLLGMPVIATFAGGIPSIIEDKKEGLLVQDGDPYALAGAIIELLKNRSYANELGTNARNRAILRHNSKRIVNKLLEIYESILNHSSV